MKTIEFQEILFTVQEENLNTYTEQEILDIENTLGFAFPDDYRRFMMTLGDGEIIFDYKDDDMDDMTEEIRVMSPSYILNDWNDELRVRLEHSWFWSEDILSQKRAMECIPIFDTSGGDETIFHPSEREQWYILPRDEEVIFSVNSFTELCNFYQKITSAKKPFKFIPFFNTNFG